mmetsp:Transcript_11722/g.27500  ORF Transcript_11722/g.27500 Transcript_11722/m.27500 type:complete len:207 (+) Transcript_11722:160-780(+)
MSTSTRFRRRIGMWRRDHSGLGGSTAMASTKTTSRCPKSRSKSKRFTTTMPSRSTGSPSGPTRENGAPMPRTRRCSTSRGSSGASPTAPKAWPTSPASKSGTTASSASAPPRARSSGTPWTARRTAAPSWTRTSKISRARVTRAWACSPSLSPWSRSGAVMSPTRSASGPPPNTPPPPLWAPKLERAGLISRWRSGCAAPCTVRLW